MGWNWLSSGKRKWISRSILGLGSGGRFWEKFGQERWLNVMLTCFNGFNMFIVYMLKV